MFSNGEREAKVRYSNNGYDIVEYGTYTICAVSGQKIPIDDLKYWNHHRQEAYASCEISYQRELECNPYLKKLLETQEK
ncbi:DUF2093 domain-containing protein [Bartonella massiliensis]|uniref:DUF2093 domain-containing protein n=1 Tax=Bartonella massiliensis TaxID=929795 RepID=UPI00115A835D|nr:DUF2093 domain-containing protein [Bartonella massiliensis]